MQQKEERAVTDQPVDFMLDFETLGTEGDSVILSVGLIVFDRDTGNIYESQYMEFDITHQILDGRKVDPDTVAWWKRTNRAELERLVYNDEQAELQDLRDLFDSMYKHYKPRKIWSRGYMDFGILCHIYGPLPYYLAADVRTLDVFGFEMDKNNHNAREDCENQVRYVVEVVNGRRKEVS